MKYLKLFITVILVSVMLEVQAVPVFNGISKTIKKMNLKMSSIVSVSVKNEKNGKTIYSKDAYKLLHPASSLKVLTFASALDTLGTDYKFSTKVYKYNNDFYIKLGADPLLTTSDLRSLIIILKKNANLKKIGKIYIDDTIIDKVNYPAGWATDDIYPYSPIISPYTLNKNQVTIGLILRSDSNVPFVMQTEPNNLTFINELQKGYGEISVKKAEDYDKTNILTLSGFVEKDTHIKIPVDNPKYNFIANLNLIFEKEKINYRKTFYFAKTPKDAREVASVFHSLEDVSREILWNSDNYVAETVFKVAGAKFKNNGKPATTQDALDMFENYYKQLEMNTKKIKIVDGSGVSRYNLISADWMTDALLEINKKNNIKKYMAQPDEGTLKKRLRHLRGYIWAKTGTLNGVSSLAGYAKTKSDKDVVFSIIIMNFNKKPSIIKGFEDDLMDKIWKL